MIYVIGIDPGDSCGFALFVDGRYVFAVQFPPDTMYQYLEITLQKAALNDGKAEIGIERFVTNRMHTTHQPTAQQVIGAVSVLAKRYGADVTEQGAADARGIVHPDEMRARGMWQTGKEIGRPDANDANMAIRHALLLIARKHATWFEALMMRS